jgi:sec-independent protein translocase protein TatB
MFDLDISKMALIGVVALVVLGPERLPRVARTAGALLGRAQRYINDVKSEVTREIEIEELRKMKTGFEEAASSVHNTIHDTVREHTADLTNAWNNGEPVSERVDQIGSNADSGSAAIPTVDNRWQMRKTHFGGSQRRNWRVRRSALPVWYKQASLKRTHIVSTAARDAMATRQAETLASSPEAASGSVPATTVTAARRTSRFL